MAKKTDGIANPTGSVTDGINKPDGTEPVNPGSGNANSELGSAVTPNPQENREPVKSFEKEAGGPRRGRPRGPNYKPRTRAGKPPGETPQDKLDINGNTIPPRKTATRKGIEALTDNVLMLNNFAAMNYNAPDFQIDREAAKTIAEPLAEILAEWGVSFDFQESPYAKLMQALISVYGAKVYVRYTMATNQTPPPQPNSATPPNNPPPRRNMYDFTGAVDVLDESAAEAARQQRMNH